MSRFNEVAFQRYQDMALSIAGECDCLLAEQRDVADFAVRLRRFLVDLRVMMAAAVITEARCTIDTTVDGYSKIMSELESIELAVGIDPSYEEPIRRNLNAASLLARKTN
jgi:hypothetical protein